MELRQLAYFVAVADAAQFTRGAARLSVAQPAVSAQIRRLERELGEALFDREQRPVRLTEAGAAFLPHARAALAAAKNGQETIASLRGLLHGQLRLGVLKASLDSLLAEALGHFHRQHPAIEILLTEQHNGPLLEMLACGDLHAAVLGIPTKPPLLPQQIKTRVYATEPVVLAVPSGHPLNRRTSISLAQLCDQPMITLTRGSGLRKLLEEACEDAGFTPRIMVETGELASLVRLVAEGLGIAVVPRSAIALDDERLAILKISKPRLQRRTALAWNESKSSPAGRAFLDIARVHLPEAPS